MVALIQTAAGLPVVLLSVPAGAIGDLVDRRRLLVASQSFMLIAVLPTRKTRGLRVCLPVPLLTRRVSLNRRRLLALAYAAETSPAPCRRRAGGHPRLSVSWAGTAGGRSTCGRVGCCDVESGLRPAG
jgi:MFS family permease